MLGNALAGVSVLDFTQIAAGPLCTQSLADLGATVTKIESPTGDLGRALAPFVNGTSVTFLALNHGKRSASLDLKDPAQRDAVLRLIAKADVVVESFRPGVMERLGMGYEQARKLNPDIIYCSVSAYGQRSPWRDKPGVDGVLQAVSGLMSVTGLPGASPCKVQVPVVDIVTGYIAAVAVLGALRKREAGGGGEWIDASMFTSSLAIQQMAFASYFSDGEVPERIGSAAPYAAPNEALRCADGWIMVAAYHPARWTSLCKIIGRADLIDDPRFHDLRGRITHRGALVTLLEDAMSTRPRSEWLDLFEKADIICAPINDYAETVTSPAFTDDLAELIDQPGIGSLKFLRTPLRTVGNVPAPRTAAPAIGKHTEEVLLEAGLPDPADPASLESPKCP
ncbi:carnitine dehydratase [Sphingobium lactosutens]|uniref:CaiB/BaiF CoA transferase family protein n=1 Tax=Sphingobium lactosutens TaxID=522773 RepID=UPI0015B7B9E7|nr:CoA transferase [Sphingobium lactosutens]NWK95964.1 carnitine dehydratase [Sphingobium lactosutens]